jgi:hypothetical protein
VLIGAIGAASDSAGASYPAIPLLPAEIDGAVRMLVPSIDFCKWSMRELNIGGHASGESPTS